MLTTYRKVQSLLSAGEKRGFFLLSLAMLGEAALEMLGIGLVPIFISAIAFPEHLSQNRILNQLGIEYLATTEGADLIFWGSAVLFVFFAVKTAYSIIITYWKARYVQNRALKLSKRLYQVYLEAPYTFHLKHGTPELLRNINIECTELANRVLLPMVDIVAQAVILVGISLVLALSVPPVVLAWLGAFIVIAALSTVTLNKKLRFLGREAQKNRAAMVRVVKEGLDGVKEIRLLQRTGYFSKRLARSFARVMEIQRFMQVIQRALPSLTELVMILGLLGAVVMLFATGGQPETIIPIVTIFAVALVRVKASVRSIMRDYTDIRHSSASLDVIHEGLSELEPKRDPEQRRRDKGPDDTRLPGEKLYLNDVIEIRDIWFRYPGADSFSLRGIDLTIHKGEAVGVVGATGAGKSTLIDVLLGVLPPDRGEILVDGQPISGQTNSWQRSLGYVPQMNFLLDGTVRENVALGIEAFDINQREINSALNAANANSFIEGLPLGVDTVIGERGVRLSGGERQRIAIARALYSSPDILVMDEATSALDNVTEGEIVKAVEELKGGRTILVIAHRLSTVRRCDRIVFLKDGRVDAVGSYDELVDRHDDFSRMAAAGH